MKKIKRDLKGLKWFMAFIRGLLDCGESKKTRQNIFYNCFTVKIHAADLLLVIKLN